MPVVQCLGAAWSTQILGRCLPVTSGASSSASCSEFPPIVVNAQGWPSSVLGTAAGGVATAVCNNGYFAAGTPRATCLSSGIWSTPSPPACEKGPARAGTAFISAGGTSQFVVCTFDGANLTNCVVDPATPGGAPALSHPAGVVTQGTKVWIAEATPIPRVRACVFQTAPLNALTSCAVSDLPGYSPPFESMLEQVAVDPVTNIGYVADYNNDCIVTCLDASAMRLCSCAQLPAGSQPVGLAMSARRDALLITVAGGLFRCTLGPTGLPGSIDDSTCRFFKTSFYPLAVLESDNALWMADGFGIHTCTAPGDAGELACGFSEAGGTLRAAGYVGLALGGGSLLIPNYDLAALSVCSSPAPSVTGCKLQAPRDLSGQPNFNMLGSVAVAVAPA